MDSFGDLLRVERAGCGGGLSPNLEGSIGIDCIALRLDRSGLKLLNKDGRPWTFAQIREVDPIGGTTSVGFLVGFSAAPIS
jgi:hypothetical protein